MHGQNDIKLFFNESFKPEHNYVRKEDAINNVNITQKLSI